MQLGQYQHFKGAIYNVIGTAKHSENEESFVVYHNIKTPANLWVRPIEMFNEVIERDGKKIKRFTFIGSA